MTGGRVKISARISPPVLPQPHALMKARPAESAPGLPPIVPRREIGSMIWRIKMAPILEMRREKAEAKEARRLARERRKLAAQPAGHTDPSVASADGPDGEMRAGS